MTFEEELINQLQTYSYREKHSVNFEHEFGYQSCSKKHQVAFVTVSS